MIRTLAFRLIGLAMLLTLVSPPSSPAAEYLGSNIDGVSYDASAYSYDTGKYYDVTVEFDSDEVTVYFARGGHITLALDDEEIDDPHDISAYDYNRSVYWSLDVDGLD